ncbi:MAG: CvpA family protein [Clostridia bacterium]|nr:CvpA family protein [Clostridia bacterium]
MKIRLSTIIKWVISIIIIGVLYWLMLPPINWRSTEMWTFLAFCIVICTAINFTHKLIELIMPRGSKHGTVVKTGRVRIKDLSAPIVVAATTLIAIVVFGLIGSATGWALFSAKAYGQLLTYQTGDFKAEIADVVTSENGKLNMDSVPVVDRDTAERLSLRKLGEMSDLVSQFEVDSWYNTQINYKGTPTRVTPLIYGDFFKWLNNQEKGIPAYITVNMETQETDLVRLSDGIKYSESEYLLRDLNRHLRFHYPTKIFDNISFEIDENGTPYWVASTVTYRIGFWSGRDIDGVVLCNAINGECTYYEIGNVPQWIDQAYDSEIILEQLTYNGEYVNGYWNSLFGQKDVLQPTDGYNYLALNDDVYLYTGMTSVSSDESNVGFVLVNLRTKETVFYECPGAEEYSAMESAQGKVQEKNYTATFPLLLNVNDRPTYFMSLKDSAGLVKMYAFVDVRQYQIVGTGTSVKEALNAFFEELQSNDEVGLGDEGGSAVKEQTVTGVIADIRSAVVDGETRYYILLQNDTAVYVAGVGINSRLPFAKVGDSVTMVCTSSADAMSVSSLELTVTP